MRLIARFQGTSKRLCGGFSVPPSVSRFQSKPEGICLDTCPGVMEVLGLTVYRHCADGAETTLTHCAR